jgi:hypothetical protein
MLSGDNYGLRVNKLFEKINKIQSSIDIEKQTKFREVLGKLNAIENLYTQAYQSRSNNFSELNQNVVLVFFFFLHKINFLL